ncbi:hypothetical protein B2J93_1692 [Marssonina coronariae]|uniref:Uncharacterized protein n=1 Tax=Diplocarpon coronariae TaxID=2795749 RepID=A0A218ZDN6_9HELO|nr:hypothetical protein B2J93_1692 [Marssonina coronariae]
MREMWKKLRSYTIPRGRVIDIVSDNMSDSYFSYRSQIPNLLHVCRGSREIDCLFDDYLGSPGPEAIEPGEPLMIEIPFDKVPAINVSCEFELTRITGPVARHEAGNIRRIALPSSFLSLYAEEDLIEAFRRLFNTFTSFGYLILNAEEPEPLTPGEILFFGVGVLLPVGMERRVRSVARGGVKRPIDSRHKHSTCSGSYVTGRQKLVRKPEKNDPMAIVLIAKKWRGENVTEWIRRFKSFEQMRRSFVPRYEDEVGFQDSYQAVYRAVDLTGGKSKEIAQADKTKKNPKNEKNKKLLRRADKTKKNPKDEKNKKLLRRTRPRRVRRTRRTRNCSGGQDQEESEEREEQEIAQADKTKKSPKNKKHKKLQKGGGAKEGEWHGEGEETDDEERQAPCDDPDRLNALEDTEFNVVRAAKTQLRQEEDLYSEELLQRASKSLLENGCEQDDTRPTYNGQGGGQKGILLDRG